MWPEEVATPIANDLQRVATSTQGGVLTVGMVLTLYFASSGIESLRIGLNRAYGVGETRVWWVLRLESVLYVIGSAIALLALSVLVVFGPLIIRLRALPRGFRGSLRADLRGAFLGDDRAGLFVFFRGDIHLWRRTERRDRARFAKSDISGWGP